MRSARLESAEPEALDWRNTFVDDFKASLERAEKWSQMKGPQEEKNEKYLLRHMKRSFYENY